MGLGFYFDFFELVFEVLALSDLLLDEVLDCFLAGADFFEEDFFVLLSSSLLLLLLFALDGFFAEDVFRSLALSLPLELALFFAFTFSSLLAFSFLEDAALDLALSAFLLTLRSLSLSLLLFDFFSFSSCVFLAVFADFLLSLS
ncbi:hypothetical protein QFZ13_01135 [Acinetobacter pseudolwoffii]|nr:hypothetical protein [Acinetobacter pseudolwoffii]MDH5818737.1 hypothetical protein [Acinetobacter pseudolwoffii]